MTYAQFHLWFTIPLAAIALYCNLNNPLFKQPRAWWATGGLVLLALSYTTPWDRYLIQSEVWAYSPDRVLFSVLGIPIEEYFFFVIQTLIGCLGALWILSRCESAPAPRPLTAADRVLMSIGAVLLVLSMAWAGEYATRENPYRYLFLVAGWASPIILLQWLIGYRILLRLKRPLMQINAVLISYFWFADWVAISKGIWFFPGAQTTGWYLVPPLPVEEALFFVVTNLMVTQGFILFMQINRRELPPWLARMLYEDGQRP